MVDYEKERTLEATSTWAVAVVCFVILAISILLEHAIHLLEKFLKKKQKVALVEALEKVKSELMLLGFISLLLTVFQGPISGICVSRKTATSWLPCRDKFKSSLTTEKYGRRLFEFSEFDGVVRRSLATKGNDKCTGKGKYAFVTAYGIHELHVFIFVLAIFHVLYCLTTLTLGNIKMRRWKSWEKETNTYDQEKFRYTRDTSFGRRHLSFWSKSSISTWIVCFFRQFIGSVTRVDYQTLRHGFIKAHLPEGSEMTFDFRKYIQRSLEDDFKVVVGISPVIWLAALLFLLTNTQGSHAHLWLPFLSLIIVLVVGTKLQVIITKLGLRINEKGHVVKGVPVVQPDDELFWFGRPRLLLFLIHFVLFQNAFQLAFFAWGTYEFGFKNCFHRSIADIVIRISMGVIIQVLCSYVTLPLYALVTQMGSSMKPTIFNEHIATAIKHWHHTAKKHTKQSHHSQGTPSISSRPATPVHLLHKHQPRSDGSLHDTERGRWVEMEFANDYSYHDESVTNAERAQHSDLVEEEQPNAPHQPPAQPATADQDETDISFSHYVVRK